MAWAAILQRNQDQSSYKPRSFTEHIMLRYRKSGGLKLSLLGLAGNASLLACLDICTLLMLGCACGQDYSYATLPRRNNILFQGSDLTDEQRHAADQWIFQLNPLRLGMPLSDLEAQLDNLVQPTSDSGDERTSDGDWRSYKLDTYWSLVITLNDARRVSSLTLVPCNQ